MTSIDDTGTFWVAQHRSAGWRCEPASNAVRDFHCSLTDTPDTPGRPPTLADELGLGRVLVKDESNRLGLPAFKALGASWAVHRILDQEAAGHPLTVVAATDGNHGRAVARFARELGHRQPSTFRSRSIPSPFRRSPTKAPR